MEGNKMDKMLTKIEEEMKKVNIKMHQSSLMMEKSSSEIVRLGKECNDLKIRLTESEIKVANAYDRLEELGEDMSEW